MNESAEVPWAFPAIPRAMLLWQGEHGYLHFIDPKGERAVIPVTRGESTKTPALGNVWHVEERGDTLVISPSIHFVGHWHSPNPVEFIKVDKLEEGID